VTRTSAIWLTMGQADGLRYCIDSASLKFGSSPERRVYFDPDLCLGAARLHDVMTESVLPLADSVAFDVPNGFRSSSWWWTCVDHRRA
jgi:hypothetical protein